MGIQIWLPIIVNLCLAGIIVAGAFIGKKRGFRFELIKFLALCGAEVGIYFLNPLVVNEVSKIEIVANLLSAGYINGAILTAISFSVLSFVVFGFICLLMGLTRRAVRRHNQPKLKGLNKADTKKLRKQQKEMLKSKFKPKKASKAFGIIFGILSALVIGFLFTLPMKPIFKQITTEEIPVEKGYEYTPYGQLDKYTNCDSFVVGE